MRDLPNVILDAIVEKHAVLRHDANRLSQAGLSDISDILTINGDTTLVVLQVVLSEQKSQDRRFARARLSNDCDGVAFRDREAQVVQRGRLVVVREVDVFYEQTGEYSTHIETRLATYRI